MIDQERFGIILSQTLNSIKHTPESFGDLYKIQRDEIIRVINGECGPSSRLISILGQVHP